MALIAERGMAQNLVLRLLEEKQTETEVRFMLWSPKMDILAISFSSGSVCLYRLQWQRIWSAGPAQEGITCSALAWRPDGKLLAAGDSDGGLTIRHIESSAALYSVQLDSEVVTASWLEIENLTSDIDQFESDPEDSQKWSSITKLPALNKTFSYVGGGANQEELEDCRKLDSRDASVLLVGTRTGTLYILMNGYLLCMKLSLPKLLSVPCGPILGLNMTVDMKLLTVVVNTSEEAGKIVVIDTPILSTCRRELQILAAKFCSIHGLLLYTAETIKQICEGWETILLEMDSKLSTYAENNPPGAVAADFLELLMFGVPNPQLKMFLAKEMSEKSLKKLGSSIEMSYSNIQRLVLRYLGAVSQSLTFELWELLGVARQGHKFSVLGVKEEVVSEALCRVQAFWSKGTELQYVIDESMKNFKAFFRWIYLEISRINEEPIVGDINKTTQQEVAFLADFLQRFQPQGGGSKVSHVHLERVGQYLKAEDLVQTSKKPQSLWSNIMENNPDLRDEVHLMSHESKTSLIKEHTLLLSAVTDVFSNMGQDLTTQSIILSSYDIDHVDGSHKIKQLTHQRLCQGLLFHKRNGDNQLLLWRSECPAGDTSLLTIQFDREIIDSSFYNKDLLTILLEDESRVQTLVQIPITSLDWRRMERTDIVRDMAPVSWTDLSGLRTRVMEGLSGCQLVVSGQRGISVCLFKSRKKIRIYDMEGEEEEEEDEDETFESSGFSSSQL